MDGQRYFTIATNDSGIADKVSYQLHILYRLGAACGFHYIHTPLTFPRSWHSHAHSLRTTKYWIERKLFLDLGMRIPGYRLIDRALSKSISLLDYAINDSGNKLNRFLGFDKIVPRITDACFSNLHTVNIPVEDILINADVKTLDDLRAAINRCCPITPSKMYRFAVEQMTYPDLEKIKNLLVKAGVDIKSYDFLGIRDNYWRARQDWPLNLPFAPEKIKLVIHYRLGDSTVLPLGGRSLYIHGRTVVDRERFEEIWKCDPGRNTSSVKYERIMFRLFNEFGRKSFSFIFISDGYTRMLESIMFALRRKELNLTLTELRIIRDVEQLGDQSLRDLAVKLNAYPIIGESNETLCKCIHAIASADVLVYASGGFASGVHSLFNQNRSSMRISVEGNPDAACRRIGEMMPVWFSKKPHGGAQFTPELGPRPVLRRDGKAK
jgi:hypothetical protein